MKKRQRKKKLLGEYSSAGISVSITFPEDIDVKKWNDFVDAFLEDSIEANDLRFGGGGSIISSWEGVIESSDRYGSVTAKDILGIAEWLDRRSDILGFKLSEPWDLNHDNNPFEDKDVAEQVAASDR